jgi:GH18 family chitinase
MVKMDTKGVKKILSFSGWSFSTDHDTAPIFGSSVSEANREKFADNVVRFLRANNLDGLDFDWEYPGAKDIPGSVPGTDSDGNNYLAFLKSVKRKLPKGKTLSIVLPASYWYLRGFPIKEMAKVVDYFIYMTYDLHGQWDYGSRWASLGCPEGSCLRSHINMTETMCALSMLTKAGARTNQIMMGISSYGRSFKMSNSKCTGPTCTFTGSNTKSEAEPGICTNSSGYIADAELRRIISDSEVNDNGKVKTWYDKQSDSDIMTWNGNWVAWMDHLTKDRRVNRAKELNLAGTSDWAVDLQEFHKSVEGDKGFIKTTSVACTEKYEDLDQVVEAANAGEIPSSCRSNYIIAAMDKLLGEAITQYEDVNNNYDGKFGYYADYIEDLINPKLINWMDNWGVDEETKKGIGNKYF